MEREVWEVTVPLKAHTTINIEQSALFSYGGYILRIENISDRMSILPMHKYVSGFFTLLNDARKPIRTAEFEVKRNSVVEKFFVVGSADVTGDVQASPDAKKCFFVQLQLTSHANIYKMLIGAKIIASNDHQAVEVLQSSSYQNKNLPFARSTSATTVSTPVPILATPAPTLAPFSTEDPSLASIPAPPSSTSLASSQSILASSTHSLLPPTQPLASSSSRTLMSSNHLILPPDASPPGDSIITTHSCTTPVNPSIVLPQPTLPAQSTNGDVISTFSSTRSMLDDGSSPSDTSSNLSDVASGSSGDDSQVSVVYFKSFKLYKKNAQIDSIHLTEKGNYTLLIERQDTLKDKLKNLQNISFTCHWALVAGSDSKLLKESFNNSGLDGHKKILEEFELTQSSASLKLELNGHTTFGSIGVEVTLTRTKFAKPDKPRADRPSSGRSQGELVWAASALEVGRQTTRRFNVQFTQSGRYYLVVEKIDKTYGSTRELGVTGILRELIGSSMCEVQLFEHTVGGNKNKPTKWKSSPFLAPASSTIEITVQSYALIGNIVFSLRLRKIPGLSAENERLQQQLLLGILLLGGFYFLNVFFYLLSCLLELGITINLYVIAFRINLGRIAFALSLLWLKANSSVVMTQVEKIQAKLYFAFDKYKVINGMTARANVYDIIKKVKAMSRDRKKQELMRWEREKKECINE